jgi:hypothetical protein
MLQKQLCLLLKKPLNASKDLQNYFRPFERPIVTPEPGAKFSEEALMASPNERSIHLLMGANTRSTAKEMRQAKIAKPNMPTPTVIPMAATVQMVAAVVSPCT